MDPDLLAQVASALGIDLSAIVDASWADNGPGWIAVLLDSAEAVLAVRPGEIPDPELKIGVAGPYPAGSPAAFEVRTFFPNDGITVEDPVTGSLNASLAAWLLSTGRASAPYVASQGTVLGRAGRVHISRDADGTIWVGGGTVDLHLRSGRPVATPGRRPAAATIARPPRPAIARRRPQAWPGQPNGRGSSRSSAREMDCRVALPISPLRYSSASLSRSA